MVGLTSLAEGWPEAMRQELVQLNLVDARVALPAEVVERALKQGRVAFTWKTLRSWIKPTPLPSVSAHDSTVLELPLKVVAPLFLARQKDVRQARRRRSRLTTTFPICSSVSPQPAAGSAPVARPPRRPGQAGGHELLRLGRHLRHGADPGRRG